MKRLLQRGGQLEKFPARDTRASEVKVAGGRGIGQRAAEQDQSRGPKLAGYADSLRQHIFQIGHGWNGITAARNRQRQVFTSRLLNMKNSTTEEHLFGLALAKPPSERAAFLDGACHDNPALRQRLDALLAAHEQTDDVLATQPEAVRLRKDASSFAKASADTSARQARPTIKLDLANEPPDEAVGQTLGRYKLLERVGEGGCGVVYVAEQTEPVRRRVALKVIKLGMDTKQVVARFEAERQALAMMNHPNIAKVLDAR